MTQMRIGVLGSSAIHRMSGHLPNTGSCSIRADRWFRLKRKPSALALHTEPTFLPRPASVRWRKFAWATVFGHNTDRRLNVLAAVLSIRRGLTNETLTFRGSLNVTASHPVYAKPDVETSQRCRRVLPLARIESRIYFRPALRLGDRTSSKFTTFTVESPHNLFAGGFLVHNKSREYDHQLDDTGTPCGLDASRRASTGFAVCR